MSHPSEELLNDYVDELLPDHERQELRRHLDGCPKCSVFVEDLQMLVNRAGELADVEPTRDLFPGIRSATRRPEARWMRWVAAAAAIIIVVLLGGLRWGGSGSEPVSSPSFETLLADFRSAEAEYIRATEQLAEGLDARRDEIEPATMAVLDRNLILIDEAIAEVRLALDRDGLDIDNSHVLTALYNRKLDVLLQASRLSS